MLTQSPGPRQAARDQLLAGLVPEQDRRGLAPHELAGPHQDQVEQARQVELAGQLGGDGAHGLDLAAALLLALEAAGVVQRHGRQVGDGLNQRHVFGHQAGAAGGSLDHQGAKQLAARHDRHADGRAVRPAIVRRLDVCRVALHQDRPALGDDPLADASAGRHDSISRVVGVAEGGTYHQRAGRRVQQRQGAGRAADDLDRPLDDHVEATLLVHLRDDGGGSPRHLLGAAPLTPLGLEQPDRLDDGRRLPGVQLEHLDVGLVVTLVGVQRVRRHGADQLPIGDQRGADRRADPGLAGGVSSPDSRW